MNSHKLRTGVIICTCRHCTPDSLNVELIGPSSKEATAWGPHLRGDVCDDPTLVTGFINQNGLQSLVICACSNPQHIKSFKSACKQAGMSPLAAEYVSLKEFYGMLGDRGVAEELARLALAVNTAKAANACIASAAVQRLARGSRARVSRRDFLHSFREMFLEYSEAPVIQPEICSRYSKSCSHCVEACQFGAITKDGQCIRIDRRTCVQCGACASVCPVGALQTPTLSDSQVAGMIEAAAFERTNLQKRILMATCDRGLALLATKMAEGKQCNPGFVVVRVPCARVNTCQGFTRYTTQYHGWAFWQLRPKCKPILMRHRHLIPKVAGPVGPAAFLLLELVSKSSAFRQSVAQFKL